MIACLVSAWLGSAWAGETDRAPNPLVARIRALQDEVAEVRGHRFAAQVAVDVQSPEQMIEAIRVKMAEELDEEEEARITTTYRVFGLVGPEVDLSDTVLAMMGEMVGGYYDPEAAALFVVDRDAETQLDPGGSGLPLFDVVAAHELGHALQDQIWGLGLFLDYDFASEDVVQALRAVVEGDATVLEQHFAGRRTGTVQPPPDDLPSDQISVGPDDPPLVLMRSLTFPYTTGARFVRAVFEARGWDGVDRLFEDRPLSTEQILHPERYLDERDVPRMLTLRTRLRGHRLVDQNTWGELGLEILFAQHRLGHPDRAAWADGWDGDTFVVLESRHDPDAPSVVAWRSVWDSEQDAIEFARGARSIAARQLPSTRSEEHGDVVELVGEAASGLVERRGDEVVVVLGAPPRRLAALTRRTWRGRWVALTALEQVLRPRRERVGTW